MEYSGMTGAINLDENGHRTYFKLDLIERRRDNMVKTGIWLPDTGVNYTTTATERDAIVVEQLQNKTLRVTTAIVSSNYVQNLKTNFGNEISNIYQIFDSKDFSFKKIELERLWISLPLPSTLS